jgi:hypothetical protein
MIVSSLTKSREDFYGPDKSIYGYELPIGLKSYYLARIMFSKCSCRGTWCIMRFSRFVDGSLVQKPIEFPHGLPKPSA